jgi:hypothetical protein
MSRQQFALDDYVDVAARIGEFRGKYPDGSLQQHSLDFREVNGGWWVIYTAAAYRTPDDMRPGHGTAWEPIPGRTPYTRDSEVQNAETAAWGRAIVAVLAADTRRGVASAEEVRNAQERREAPPQQVGPPPTYDELRTDAEMAPSNDALNSVAYRARNTHAAGHLTDQQLDALKQVVTARRANLAAQPALPTGDAA